MKKTTLALAMGLMISGAANAALEANIGATSNYLWRGVTQTADDAAFSGGLDYSHDSGAYAGIWTSNLDNGAETDYYAGFSSETESGLGYDLGYIYYAYSDVGDADFSEVTGSLTKDGFTLGISYTVGSQTHATSAANETVISGDTYYYASGEAELTDGWGLTTTLGYFDFKDDGVAATDTSYAHVQFDLTKAVGELGDVTMSVSKAEKESGSDKAKFFVSLSKSF
jgi:uncharacterized protein (TIGR02001 family)